MQRKLKFGILLTAVSVGSLNYFATGKQASASGVSVSSPRSLYVQNCARCHGSNGTSQTALGRKLEADDLTTAEVKGDSNAKIIRVITTGRGDMPGFKKKLTSAQIAQIAAYVKTL